MVNPTAWTDTARVVVNTLRWALPAAKLVCNAVLNDPGRTQVARVIDAVIDYNGRFESALTAYEQAGGDRCAAKAAAAATRQGLIDLCQVLADNGLALGRPLERVVDSVSSVVDMLIPACDDAGWSSAGDDANARLRAIEAAARARGVTLRRNLDSIEPPAQSVDAGVQ